MRSFVTGGVTVCLLGARFDLSDVPWCPVTFGSGPVWGVVYHGSAAPPESDEDAEILATFWPASLN